MGDACTLLHAADLHLEISFAHDTLPPEVGLERRAALRRDLRRILKVARERSVQAVTIAGDLYDAAYATPELGEFLATEFAEIAPIRVLIAPGESDPFVEPSIYSITRWPDNVTIFRPGALSSVQVSSDVQVWGIGLPQGRDRHTWLSSRPLGEGFQVLLAHAVDLDRASPQRTTAYPLRASAIKESGFALALLGHEHCARVWPEEESCCVYPGSPEPLTAEESSEPHGVTLVTIDGGHVSLEAVPLGQFRYVTLGVDLTDCASRQEIVLHVEQALDDVGARHDRNASCTVRLTGTPKLGVDTRTVLERIDARAFVRLVPDLDLPYDLPTLARERTVRGTLFANSLAEMQRSADPERQGQLRALKLALASLSGHEGRFDEV